MRGCGCRCRERWSGTSPGLTRKCVTREIVEAELDDLAVEGDEFVREGDSDAGEQYFLEGFVDEPPDDGRLALIAAVVPAHQHDLILAVVSSNHMMLLQPATTRLALQPIATTAAQCSVPLLPFFIWL